MNRTDNRISDAMRQLSAIAPGGAPSTLGDRLKDEFQRHHARRRRNQIARISLIAACLLAAVAWSIWVPRKHSTSAIERSRDLPAAPSAESTTAVAIDASAPRAAIQKSRVSNRGANKAGKTPAAEPARFVALPTFDPAIPIDHLQMVRVDVPGRSLELVGFAVTEEIANGRVVADVLLAQDGTPYALRLVGSSVTKEQ